MRIFLFILGVAFGVLVSLYAVHHQSTRLQAAGIVPAAPEPTIIVKTEVIDKTVNPCAWDETRNLPFLSWEEESDVTIKVYGADCDYSVLQLIVHDESRRVYLDEIVRLGAITANRETGDDMPRIMKRYWEEIGPSRTSELAPWAPAEEMFEKHYQWSAVEKDDYERARTADAPLICMRIYYETANCYWYDPVARRARHVASYGV
jgi:hypothetical protein